MSWLENVDKGMRVMCGDGRIYEPLWVRSTVEKDYNTSEFEFIEVSGTLVRKYKPKGSRYSLRICFEGDNHLDDVASFMKSADDQRPWTISHPLHGSINGQPVRIGRDDTAANVTELTILFVESITEESPQVTTAPGAKVISDKSLLDDLVIQYYAVSLSPSSNIINPFVKPSSVIRIQKASLSQIYNSVAKKVKGATDSIKDKIDAENYFNLFNQANSAIVNLTSDPIAAARSVSAMINAPFNFLNSVKSRIDTLVTSYNAVRSAVLNLNINQTPVQINTIDRIASKRIYETNALMIISSMTNAAILQYDAANNELTSNPTPPESSLIVPNDYTSRQDVMNVIDAILDVYNTFLGDIDVLQSETGGDLDSYVPDFNSMNNLNSLVDFTISQLLDIVLDSKQERIIDLPEDMNVITIAHRYYGLDLNDVNLQRILDNNNIGISELLNVSKGRKITYYV